MKRFSFQVLTVLSTVTSTISWNEYGIAATRVGRALQLVNKGANQKRKIGNAKKESYIVAILLSNTKEVQAEQKGMQEEEE